MTGVTDVTGVLVVVIIGAVPSPIGDGNSVNGAAPGAGTDRMYAVDTMMVIRKLRRVHYILEQ